MRRESLDTLLYKVGLLGCLLDSLWRCCLRAIYAVFQWLITAGMWSDRVPCRRLVRLGNPGCRWSGSGSDDRWVDRCTICLTWVYNFYSMTCHGYYANEIFVSYLHLSINHLMRTSHTESVKTIVMQTRETSKCPENAGLKLQLPHRPYSG